MKIKITLLMMLMSALSFATHNRGGYIAMEHVSGYTYKIKFVSITNVGPQIQADRCTITVNFSDGDSVILNRVNGPTGSCAAPATMGVVIANGIKYNVYEGFKTFATQGNFTAWAIDANRNDGIINIPGSVNVPFYCETFLRVFDPVNYCPVSTVDFGFFPAYNATINSPFYSDLPIVMTDGDSITYRIDTCKTSFGNNIVGYSIPQGVAVNSSNGKFTISSPQQQGQFNFAIRTNKWRNGVLVSYTILDFGMDISASFINNVQLPINSNLSINNDSIYIGNFAITDTIKINYDNTSQYQVNLYSEIDSNLIEQGTLGNITSLKITNLTSLERKQPYKLTLRAWKNLVTTNASKDYIFYFTIGNTDSTLCTLPLDLGSAETIKNAIQLYPNPAHNELFINNAPLNSYIQFYNLQGQLVLNKALQKASVNIDELQNGLYLYRIYNANSGVIFNGKLIKD
jgi:hypothetical protein